MDPRKFDYLETIREKIEAGDYEDLQEYIDTIHDHVKNDPHFTEILEEISSKKFDDALSLIDEVIFEDLQAEFEEFYQEGELAVPRGHGEDDPDYDQGLGEEASEGIIFEEFNEENYYGGNNPEDDL